jgi:hypothetical protein
MSASHEWFEWHLTPRGWEEGSFSLDFQGKTVKPEPDDRVATYVLDEYQGHSMSPMQRSWDESWSSGNTAIIGNLKKQFGDHPSGLLIA